MTARIGAVALAVSVLWLRAGVVAQQQSGAQAATSATTVTPVFRNITRVEAWDFFAPHDGGGDPDYVFIANRLLGGVRVTGRWFEVNGTLQYVQFGGLPSDAVGPGVLGSGGTYYDHNRETSPGEVYLKALNVLLRDASRGLSVRVGRMGYASGGEAPSGDAAIEAVKRMRIDSRLVGEFEWSLFQRAFDGMRGDWSRPAFQVTGSALWPTQGGFEQDANASLKDVRTISGVLTFKPSARLRHTEVQLFTHHYADHRPVTGRPDNSGRSVTQADISFVSTGGHLVGVYPAGPGRADVLAWTAVQNGDWYESDQGAWAMALEGGYQWTATNWSPWVRAGWNRSSGDDDPSDNEHGTFMPPVPTGRKYSYSTAYTFMNLDDRFVQLHLKPRGNVSVRADLHWLTLAEPTDRWYAGSGATRRAGSIFGYAGRTSGGSDDLGTILEGSVDWTINRRWSVNGYIGRMYGGDVVRATFAGDRLLFGYFENVISF